MTHPDPLFYICQRAYYAAYAVAQRLRACDDPDPLPAWLDLLRASRPDNRETLIHHPARLGAYLALVNTAMRQLETFIQAHGNGPRGDLHQYAESIFDIRSDLVHWDINQERSSS